MSMDTDIDVILHDAAIARQNGDTDKAIRILQLATNSGSANDEVWLALAFCYQAQSDAVGMALALDGALEVNPKNITALIFTGILNERQGRFAQAIKHYAKAATHRPVVSPLDTDLLRKLDQAESRIPALNNLLEKQAYSELNQLGFEPGQKDKRFEMALDIMFGRKQVFYQEPHQFYYPELPQRQFYDPDEFPWMDDLRQNWQAIRDEAKHVMEDRDELFAPYLKSDPSEHINTKVELMDNPDWSAFYLIKDSVHQDNHIALCPVTMKALERAPLDHIPGRTPSVLYSLLKPDTHIPPHTGMLNTRLICHLPLIVPEKCGFRVGNEQIEWVEGEPFAFDDSINHEAWNRSHQNRIILLFEIWRPELSERERVLISKLIELSG